MSMGYFKSANVIFNEQADSVAKDNYVTFVGEGKSRPIRYIRPCEGLSPVRHPVHSGLEAGV